MRAKGNTLCWVKTRFAKQSHQVWFGIASCLAMTVRSGLWFVELGHGGTHGLRTLTQVSSLRAKGNTLCRGKTFFAKQSHQVMFEIASCLAMTVQSGLWLAGLGYD
ncbi:MAG: hypothetical protein JSS98_10510 [Bacteroidetes bacterium]|nr:hypothetical protein [Bacteroidota bacterium]